MNDLPSSFSRLAGFVSTTRVQRALPGRVTVREDSRGISMVFVDGKVVGPYYRHGLVSTTDLAGSHLTFADLDAIGTV